MAYFYDNLMKIHFVVGGGYMRVIWLGKQVARPADNRQSVRIIQMMLRYETLFPWSQLLEAHQDDFYV